MGVKCYWFQTCLRKKFHARATSSSSSSSSTTAFPRSQKTKKKVSTRVSFGLERGEKTGTRMRMMMKMAVVEFPDLNPHYNNNQYRWEQLQPKTNSRCSRQKQNEWTREESTLAYTTHIIVQGAEEATTQRNTERHRETEKHTHTHTHTRWQGCETRRACESVRLKRQNRKRHELQSSARARSGGDLGYWKKGQWERGERERERERSCSCCKEACSSSSYSNKKQQSERAMVGGWCNNDTSVITNTRNSSRAPALVTTEIYDRCRF